MRARQSNKGDHKCRMTAEQRMTEETRTFQSGKEMTWERESSTNCEWHGDR